ncbi:MAG: hypothetical protein K0S33_3078 [Bacteroidetes bacterium]|jgi:hypothetical protein|nr:hypothetical protein [Bacteroidota bacterium]
MYRSFLFSFLIVSLSAFPIAKGKEPIAKLRGNPAPGPQTAAVEAIVTTGNYGCGFLLRLNDGQLIHPVNLPKKFCTPGEKVVLVLDEVTDVRNSPCDVRKEVHIASIKPYRLKPGSHGKY